MAHEQFEFEFDDDGEAKAVGREPEVELPEPEDDEVVDDEPEVEVVDDTPESDRDKVGKKAPPAEEVTEEELASYSKDVQRRIKHLQRNYHDERREKEEALRERQALIQYAEALQKKLQESEGTVSKSRQTMLDQAKRAAQSELEQAKAKYKAAYESGDADALVEAQEKLTDAKIRFDKVANFKLPPVQPVENDVKPPVRSEPAPTVDKKAAAWRDQNSWFGGTDPDSMEKTAFALGVHQKLVSSGVDPRSDEYYEKLNSRLKQVFPDLRDDEDDEVTPQPKAKAKSVVAPATRSVAPKKITLSKSQLAIATRLGLTPLQYAKELAALEN
jgi:hypothetical protein